MVKILKIILLKVFQVVNISKGQIVSGENG